MVSLLFAVLLLAAVVWAAKNFYFPTDMAQNPEKYPLRSGQKISKRELSIALSHIQRWKAEGKISREEYDHLTDICLSEIKQLGGEGEV